MPKLPIGLQKRSKLPLHSCPFPTHPGTGMDTSNFRVTATATPHSAHTSRYTTTPPRLQPCTQPNVEAQPNMQGPSDQMTHAPSPLCNCVHSHPLFPPGIIPMSLPSKSEGMGKGKRRRNEGRSRGDTQPKAIGWPLYPEPASCMSPLERRMVLTGAGISLQEGALGIEVPE